MVLSLLLGPCVAHGPLLGEPWVTLMRKARGRAAMRLLDAAAKLRDEVDAMRFGGRVALTYNPLHYAWQPHAHFVSRYGADEPRAIVLLGMNPGPWGMAQTGVPFGTVSFVRDWMGIEGHVAQPPILHAKRPVQGFACPREEVSGQRLWGWAQARYHSPEAFFARYWVVNYCPLLFFDETGKNLTPPDLLREDAARVESACDDHLAEVLRTVTPKWLLGVGKYAQAQAERVVAEHALDIQVESILHPSPASPLANRGWAAQVNQKLTKLGIA